MLLAQLTNSVAWKFLSQNKDVLSSLDTCLKILALCIGAYWTWRIYVRKREKFPRAELRHRIEHSVISSEDRLVRIVLIIDNKSEVLLKVQDGHTRIELMQPWPHHLLGPFKDACEVTDEPRDVPHEVGWLLVGEKLHKDRELEPKETDEIAMDFIVRRDYEKILVRSFIDNSRKRRFRRLWKKRFRKEKPENFGWNTSSIVTFETEETVIKPKLNEIESYGKRIDNKRYIRSPKERNVEMTEQSDGQRQGQSHPRPLPAVKPGSGDQIQGPPKERPAPARPTPKLGQSR